MKTNFFQAITHLHGHGKWIVTAEFTAEKTLAVSVLLSNRDRETCKMIEPMLFRGTPQEIDEGFFTAIAEPVKQTASLFANADAYQKSLDDAKQDLDKKAKKAGERPKPDPKDNSDKQVYEEKMKKVAELDAACKYSEALAELPNAADFPEKKSEIETRKVELDRKSAQLSLL